MAHKISQDDVSVSGSVTNISGEGAEALRDSLVKKNVSTIGELAAKFVFVDPAHISIDSNGNVNIDNTDFAKAVMAAKGDGDDAGWFDTNCHCGGTA